MASLAMVVGTMMLSAPAAQARNLYLDMWCKEQGLEKARCDERRAEDVAVFEEYWRAVERYEEKYVVERENYKNFRDELNNLDEASHAGFQGHDAEKSPRPD
jgi:hypothetical protein